MVPLGAQAPEFTLPDTSGTMTGRDDFTAAPALLVAFLCNHCPYVRHVETALGTLLSHYPDLAVVGIYTNDADAYPDDRPHELAGQARRAGWNFPYLVDADQKVGRDRDHVPAADAGHVVVSPNAVGHRVLGLPPEEPGVEPGGVYGVGLVGVNPARHPARPGNPRACSWRQPTAALTEHPGSEPLELDHADDIAAPDGITHLRDPIKR